MDIFETIYARRSVRKYKKGAIIPQTDIEKLLSAAMHAPSAVNSRPWEFYCTDKEDVKAALMRAHPASRMLETASWAIVVCARPELQPRHGYWPQDCGAAVENILLAARGTDDVKKAIGCDSVPVGIVAVGVPDEEPAAKGFYDAERVKFI